LNWPADLAVSTTPGGAQQNTIQVRASTPEQLWVTPVDVDGLPVPRFRDWDGNVLQLDVLKGATTLTQTTGTGTSRSFTVDQPAGSYAFSLKGYCDGYCAVDYVDGPLQRGFSLEAGAGRLPAAPGTPVAQAGDGQASVSWPATPDAGSGTGLTYTVVAARTGDAGAGTHSCQTTTLSCTVTGLSNLAGSAEPYTFRVRATTSVGSSGWSADSNAVWPHVAVVPAAAPAGTPTVSWSSRCPPAGTSATWCQPTSGERSAVTSAPSRVHVRVKAAYWPPRASASPKVSVVSPALVSRTRTVALDPAVTGTSTSWPSPLALTTPAPTAPEPVSTDRSGR
jgi:hypothetical protein